MDTGQLKLLRMAEVVELTSLSRAKVYQMAACGQLPTVRMGRSVRVPAAALHRWIENRTTDGEQSAA